MQTDEIAELMKRRLMSLAVEMGAKPSSVVVGLIEKQNEMRAMYLTGNLRRAIEVAESIGEIASQERARIDRKWEEKFKSGYNLHPFQDLEYMSDFASMFTCDKWIEVYGSNGEFLTHMKNTLVKLETGEVSYTPPTRH